MKLLALFAVVLMLPGCAFFQAVGDKIDHDEQVAIVRDTARAGTFAALEQFDDKEERAQELIDLIDSTVLPTLLSDAPVGQATATTILSLVPTDYEVYLAPAFTTFNAYFDMPPVGELVSEDNLELLVALFEGIKAGAEKTIE